MAWATPAYSRNQVDKAGKFVAEFLARSETESTAYFIANFAKYEQCLKIVNNWRSAHSYPLNTFQTTLRHRARSVDQTALVAQRIKRLESIRGKLERQSTQLSQMQDIGGCRAVVATQLDVVKLVNLYTSPRGAKRFEHSLKWEKDYITDPKPDGYRSHHLIYAYQGGPKAAPYNNLRIEVQIRSSLQHAWATAVEAVGTFTKQALKSKQGSETWLRFFSLMGSAIAMREKTSLVPNTPSTSSVLRNEIRELQRELRVIEMLSAFSTALDYTNKVKDAKYFLLRLDLSERRLTIKRFTVQQSQEATEAYTETEKADATNSSVQVVLVSVDSIAALKRAYPNYFLDTDRFSKLLTTTISRR